MPHILFRATLAQERFSADELANGIDAYAEVLEKKLEEQGASDIEIKVPLADDDQVLFTVEVEGLEEPRLDALVRSVAASSNIKLQEIDDSSIGD